MKTNDTTLTLEQKIVMTLMILSCLLIFGGMLLDMMLGCITGAMPVSFIGGLTALMLSGLLDDMVSRRIYGIA